MHVDSIALRSFAKTTKTARCTRRKMQISTPKAPIRGRSAARSLHTAPSPRYHDIKQVKHRIMLRWRNLLFVISKKKLSCASRAWPSGTGAVWKRKFRT